MSEQLPEVAGDQVPVRPSYNPRVVRWVIRFLSWVSRKGLADAMYLVVGAPMWLVFHTWGFWRHDIEIRGTEHIPPRGGRGFFLLSNHQSLAEGPALGSWFYPRGMWFPSKAEFYRGWVSGLIYLVVTGWRTFPVRRGEKDMDAIGFMEELLKKGDNVLLFPEGTRSRDGELLPGKVGAGMLIHNARPVVLPVYVEGFNRIWPTGGKSHPLNVPRGQRALIQFGPVMDLSHHWERPSSKETAQAIVDEVMDELTRLKELAADWRDEAP